MNILQITKPGEIRLAQAELPAPKQGEALLRVRYCGICGADVASFTGNQPFTTYPRIPGHEFSAEIVEIPANEKGIKTGDLVTCNPYFNCGTCYSCERGLVNACTDNQTMGVQRDGSFSEYIAMPVSRIFPGKGLSAKELALVEPFAISQHALSRAPVKAGDRLLVVGAGPIGLFALIAAKQKGARVAVTDLLENRLALAERYGADCIINSNTQDVAQAAREFTQGKGFDVCVEACGLPETFLTCIEQAAFGANLILIGNGKRETTFNHSILLKKELNIFGSRNAYSHDFEALIILLAAGKVDVMQMVSGVYPFARAQEAFEALAHNDGTLAKLLVEVAPC